MTTDQVRLIVFAGISLGLFIAGAFLPDSGFLEIGAFGLGVTMAKL